MPSNRTTRTLLASATLVMAAATGLTALPATAAVDAGPSGAATLTGSSSAAAVAGLRTSVASGTAAAPYAFSAVLDGKPIRWNPCAPIRWTANTSRGPAGGLGVLKEAVARIAQQTGTTWQYVGPTSTVPRSGYVPRTAAKTYPPVLIGWTDGASSDLLRGQSRRVLGMTRTSWLGVRRADGSKVAATRGAVIALDRTDALPLRGGTSWSSVALHELGHAMGLAHVRGNTQLMSVTLPRGAHGLQRGDKAGLVRLGRSAGCVVVPGR